MMVAANPSTLLHLLLEFFSEALLHYDDATPDGKAYIDKAMASLIAVFEASWQDDFEIAAAVNLESVREPLETLFLTWRDKRARHPRRKGDSMKKLHTALALAILSTSLCGSIAVAQDHHDNHQYVEHKEWKRGTALKQGDWDRADKVDYRQNHLKAPPEGYEWRMVDGQYVLANSSTFQIRTVVRIP
jgi:Ni/Co efflux regulator RcnB